MIWRLIGTIVILYLSWLGMLATHELGHVVDAWISGGKVLYISFPLLGFSQTFVNPNPHPQFVAWGGSVWGVVIPFITTVALHSKLRRPPIIMWFFAGFCLIANGAYIGLGWIKRSGDAHDLMRFGAPLPALILFGAMCFIGGLVCWHRIPSSRWRLM